MTPASQIAAPKEAVLSQPRPLRRWPLLWTASFVVGVSLALWAGIFLVANWVLTLIPHA